MKANWGQIRDGVIPKCTRTDTAAAAARGVDVCSRGITESGCRQPVNLEEKRKKKSTSCQQETRAEGSINGTRFLHVKTDPREARPLGKEEILTR